MAKGMGSCRLGYPRFLHGFFHRLLQYGFMQQMMAPFFSRWGSLGTQTLIRASVASRQSTTSEM